MKIAVIGTGYVGLVAGVCFASQGNDVICVDNRKDIVEKLRSGVPTIFEPGLKELMEKAISERSSYDSNKPKLQFSTDLSNAIEISDVVFIAVGTPMDDEGKCDLSAVKAVAEEIGKNIKSFKIIVNKSTVPVGTGKLVEETIRKITKTDFAVVSNPEFLKEGAAIQDFLFPDRVIVGHQNEDAARIIPVFKSLYSPFMRQKDRLIFMSRESAELTKYAANAMLATRISFMNELSRLAEATHANIDDVRRGIGSDERIGSAFLYAGPGYGGSCFPKDVSALLFTAKQKGVDLEIVAATERANKAQRKFVISKIISHYKGESVKNKKFCIWGGAFKAKTDDIRMSPALDVVDFLISQGAQVSLYDPEAMANIKKMYGNKVSYIEDPYTALVGNNALVIMTEWNEFRSPNFDKMIELSDKVVFDMKNLYSKDDFIGRGIKYISIGRP